MTKLTWRKPSVWRQRFDLCWDDHVLGTFQVRGVAGRRGEFQSGERHWLVSRTGFFKTQIEIIDRANDAVLARYRQESLTRNRGGITFATGETFSLTSRGLLEMKFEVLDQKNNPVLSWRTTWGFGKDRIYIESIDGDLHDDHVAAMALIALRIKIQQTQNAAAGG